MDLQELWEMAAEIAIVRTGLTPPGALAMTTVNPAEEPPYIIVLTPEVKEMLGGRMHGFALVHELAHIARMDLLKLEEIEQLAEETGVSKEKAEDAWRVAAEVFCNHAPRRLFPDAWKHVNEHPGFITWSKVRPKVEKVAPHFAAWTSLPWGLSTYELAKLLIEAGSGPCGNLLCDEGCHPSKEGEGDGDAANDPADSDCQHHGGLCGYDITEETVEELIRRAKVEKQLSEVMNRILGGKKAGSLPSRIDGAHARTDHDRELERAVAMVMARLKSVMADSVPSDNRRRSWRREGRTPLLRGSIRATIPPVALCIDASGSTSEMEAFLNGLAQALGPTATVIVWDADVRAVFPAGGRIRPFVSDGGTDPLCLVPELEQIRPGGVVVVTDGECTMPSEAFAAWPTIVVTTGSTPAKWEGEVVKVRIRG